MRSRTLFAVLAVMIALALDAAGQEPVAIHTFACNSQQFQGGCPNGGAPQPIIQGSDGNFYGVAEVTAASSSGLRGGLVYSLTPAGTFRILYQFFPGKKRNYPDGTTPLTLAEGPGGMLYGATEFGGAGNMGTLFRLNKDGSGFQVLRSLCKHCENNQIKFGPWVLAGDGNFYGLAPGVKQCIDDVPCGAIYRITPATGADKFVVNFKSPAEYFPTSLLAGPDGTLYGTLTADPSGTSQSQLFHYDEVAGKLQTSALDVPIGGRATGAYRLILGPNGNFYGLYDYYDGDYLYPTGLFEVQLDGSNLQVFPVIPNFAFAAGMAFGADGNIWMAQEGSGVQRENPEYGAIVTVSPTDGSLIQTLDPFSPTSAAGGFPIGLISGSDGKLWGVSAEFGKASQGLFGAGVVFNLTP
jgi:uncharacterized repeat protein (TIGR03803 family)